MSNRLLEKSGGEVAVLGRVSLDTVLDYREQMLAQVLIRPGGKVVFDLSSVEIDGSVVLALLVDVLRESNRLGTTIEYQACPPSVISIAELSGLQQVLPMST